MKYINDFIVILVIMMIFITAVEIIAPDNSMKKYIKFVLGLILISVMLNPIIYFFTKGEQSIIEAVESYEEMLYMGSSETIEKNTEDEKVQAFKENLDKNCDALLKDEFSGKTFKSNVECTLDMNNMTYTIDKLEVGVKDNSVKLIDKIDISINKSEETISDKAQIEDEEKIKEYLAETFKIPVEKIEIYSLEGR